MGTTLTYVYCLVRATRPPSLGGAPAPLPGSRPLRLLEVSGVGSARVRHWLVVSSVPGRLYDEAALERGLQRLEWVGPRALAHEAVVEYFLRAPAVLPMQLFALFTSDDRAIEHIAADRRRLMRILSRIEGRVEWGIRVTWKGRQRGADPGTTDRRGLTPGMAYLARKRDALDAARVRLRRASAGAARVYRALGREASAARRRTEVEQATPGSRVVLDAAFLVPAGRARAFRAAVRRHARPLERLDLAVSLTGPWPAYNFI